MQKAEYTKWMCDFDWANQFLFGYHFRRKVVCLTRAKLNTFVIMLVCRELAMNE